MHRFEAHFKRMNSKEELAPPRPLPDWTRPDDYVVALARRRTERRKREPKRPRTQPEAPRFILSTLPFLVLMAAMLVISIGLFVAAWPAGHPQPQPRQVAQEQGVAKKGWFQEAEKEFQ